MKRRDLFKWLLALPFASKAIAESFARTREVIAINVPPRTPQGATAYISGLYRKSHDYLVKRPLGKNLYGAIETAHAIGLDPYIISGEGKTKEEAWRRFWEDFDIQTVEWYNLGKSNKDIFWRKVVEEEVWRDWDKMEGVYKVSCRFSLGDFT